MTVLPIAERELRVASRSPRTYWSRALAALIVAILALLIFDSYVKLGQTRAGGEQVFASLAYLALVYALFAGAALTADCLSSEKREETLGFLFLTDLKGYDVVLGKLFATSLRSIYGLLGTFPIMSLPLLLGGVRASEFWRVILVLLNSLLLSLSMGLLISTLFRRQRVTTHLASLLMLLLAVIPLGMGLMIRSIGNPTAWFLDPSVLSPIYTLQTAFDSGYRLAALVGAGFWAALLVQFTIGILLLARASWLLPRSWQESESRVANNVAPADRGLDQRLMDMQRRLILDQNPFYWLAARGRAATVGLMSLVAFVGLWGLQAWGNREDFAAVQGVGILLVALVTRLLIAVVAAQRLAEDKQSGALDLVITTPIDVRTILAGQWQAIVKKLGWPFLASLVLYVFLIFGSGQNGAGADQEGAARWFTALCFFILTFADPIALGWLGMWTGLRTRQIAHGAALCLLKIVLPPAMVAGAFVWTHGVGSVDEYLKTNPYWLPSVWLGLGLITDLAWTLWARRKLFTEFRLAATDRFERAKPISGRWWQATNDANSISS